jgi:hypothetical protein
MHQIIVPQVVLPFALASAPAPLARPPVQLYRPPPGPAVAQPERWRIAVPALPAPKPPPAPKVTMPQPVLYVRAPPVPAAPRWKITYAEREPEPEPEPAVIVVGAPTAAITIGIADGFNTNTTCTPADLTQPGTVWISNFTVVSIDAGEY